MVDNARLFAALGDPTRMRVVELLSEKPHRAGELAARLGVSAPVLSRHLRILLRLGLIGDERTPADARVRIFHLEPGQFTAVQAWLDQVAAHWTEQLGSFRDHVNRRQR